MDMRGLAHFIQDIRAATSSREDEQRRVDLELAKIRAKFNDTATMSTYDRKKYVCKLMFIAMLGYRVEFGHIEGVKLLACAQPAEKLIGYLSITVFLNESHELLTLATHRVFLDLISNNDFSTSLALTAIANAGGKAFAEQMADGVLRIVLNVGGTVDPHIHKKAILTYLQLYRKHPAVVDLKKAVPAVSQLLRSPQMGLCMCAVTFLSACVGDANSDLFESVPELLIDILFGIIMERCTEPEYVFYGVPAPWLQGKVLRLLQHFPVPQDSAQRSRIFTVLRKILKATEKVALDAQTQQRQRGTVNRVSSMNAVLFEALSLIIHWNADPKLMAEGLEVLNNFVVEKREGNIRYLGLSLLTRLKYASFAGFNFEAHCRQYQQHIVVALHDMDISIRKRALDVTFSLCNEHTANTIITDLLAYLPVAELSFKEDLVLAIAVLAEKFCKDHSWYVDVMLAVIISAGSVAPAEIYHRLVHVVVNNSTVQNKAAMALFKALRQKKVRGPLVRVAAFVLGEFGYQIALHAESPPLAQFEALAVHVNLASVETLGVILTAFAKFYNQFDNVTLRERVLKALRSFSHSMDVELQQLATELLGLIESGNDDLLQYVLGPMPPFVTSSAIIFDLMRRKRRSVGSDLWGAKADVSVSEITAEQQSDGATEAAKREGSRGVDAEKGGRAVHDEAANPPIQLQPAALAKPTEGELDALLLATISISVEELHQAARRSAQMFHALLSSRDGILYENQDVQVHCTYTIHNADSRLTLRVTTREGEQPHRPTLAIFSMPSGLILQSRLGPVAAAHPNDVIVEFAARLLTPFIGAPTVRLDYITSSGKAMAETISLPLVLTSFITTYNCSSEREFHALVAAVVSQAASEEAMVDVRVLPPHSVSKKTLELMLRMDVNLFIVEPEEATDTVVLASGALALHGGIAVQFEPVLLRCELQPSGEWALQVTCPIRTVGHDVARRCAQCLSRVKPVMENLL